MINKINGLWIVALGLAAAASYAAVSAVKPGAAPPAEATRGLKGAVMVTKGDPSRRVALVVGNARYAKRPLANSVKDAESIAAALASLGFEVVRVTDAGRTQMVRALDEFKGKVAGAGVGLFYFAGHGIQMDGRNYLIPVDADMASEDQVKYNTIRLDDVLDNLAAAAPRVKIVVLDACRDNPFERSRSAGGGGLAAVTDAPEGTLIAFATSPGRVAQDGKPGQNGLYTGHLLDALKQPGLRIEEVFKVTRAAVAQSSGGRQLPWETTSLVGTLILRPGAAADTPVTTTAAAASTAVTTVATAVRGFEPQPRARALAPGATFKDCERCPEMVVIPDGSFRMGSAAGEADRRASEGPQREVRIPRRFAAGRFEVTFEEWEACLLDGGCDRWPADQGWGRGRRPVVDVSWEDASLYVAWLSRRTGKQYRLLSEAEWEYVARAGTTTARPWGDALSTGNANCASCGNDEAGRRTTPVGSFKTNAWGIADALGNVWEWVADCRNPGYDGAPGDGTPWLTGDCAQRAMRGGSWLTEARGVRVAARAYFPVQRRDVNIGFRVATAVD